MRGYSSASPAAPILRLQRRRAGLAEADVENAFDDLSASESIPSRRRLGDDVNRRFDDLMRILASTAVS